MYRVILILMVLVFPSVNTFAQKSADGEKKAYPTVFQIGQLPNAFEELSDDYETGLLDVCNDDVKKAHIQWILMLKEMEKHATANDFNLNGIKMWMKVFWNKNGTIKHIAFHLKPASKNVDRKALEKFLNSFIKSYQGNVKATENFSQYSGASFPTLPQLIFDKKTKK